MFLARYASTLSRTAALTAAFAISTALFGATGGFAAASLDLEAPKPSIAVARFTALPYFANAYGGEADIGGGLSAMLTTALIESDAFLVVERPQLVDVFAEQQLTTSKLTVGNSSAQPGQLIGARWLITGHVTEFTQSARGGGFSVGVAGGGGLLGLAPQKRLGVVGIDVRVLDTTSGQVISSFKAREEIKARSIGVNLRYGDVDLGKSRFKKTPLGKAARAAIDSIADRLAREISATPWSGRVVDYDGNEVVINAGAESGIRTGATFRVVRRGRQLTDPETGRLLGYRETAIGTIRVTEVQGQLSFASFVANGQLVPSRNDLVLTF